MYNDDCGGYAVIVVCGRWAEVVGGGGWLVVVSAQGKSVTPHSVVMVGVAK